MLFADAHTHVNPIRGLGAKAIAKKFKDSGGWFMAIVGLSPWSYGLEPSIEGYEKTFRIVLRECNNAKEEGVKVACFIGLHPGDLDKLVYKYSVRQEKLMDFVAKVFNIIEDYCRKGLIDGIGEVGRPHYRVDPIFVVASELVMEKAMVLAKDYDLLLHLHLEQGDGITVESIKRFIKLTGVLVRLVIFHHARPGLLEHVVKNGFTATVPGIEAVLRTVFKRIEPTYLLESDFIDDPNRPGVVVYPWQMIDNQLRILKEGLVNDEYLAKLNIDNVVKVYRVSPP